MLVAESNNLCYLIIGLFCVLLCGILGKFSVNFAVPMSPDWTSSFSKPLYYTE